MKRILIVDDDAKTLRLLYLRLKSHGYAVIEADSAEQALNRRRTGAEQAPNRRRTGAEQAPNRRWRASVPACRT